ncbi:MAG: GtrA family protein, partial [Oscillospiraceae bacterium]|nr:GtrA family protein [Oscillospiraceae bacterium]
MCDKKDIFDKIMSLRVFAPIYPFYKKHKEVLMYLFFGALTTVISIVTFSLFFEILKINELISNVISWIVAVLFAFVTNRIWVFEKGKNEGIIFQGIKFYGGRVATLLIEEIILLVFVT